MRNLLLYFVILLGVVVRVTMLDIFPFGFTPDEASIGYDAYSILLTGKDQWGNSFPLIIQTFDEYKYALYSYLTMPTISLFGLNKMSVRLTNAIFGSAVIFVTYFLAGEFGKLSKLSNNKIKKLQFISTTLIALSPWHIMMSRGAFEANLTTFFLPLGVYLFLKSLKYNKLIILSVIVFGINLISHYSATIVTPVLMITLFILFRKEFLKYTSRIKYTSFITVAFIVFITLNSLSSVSSKNIIDSTIYSNSTEAAVTDKLIALERGMPVLVSTALHNKYVVTVERFVQNYTKYTSYDFLFNHGATEDSYGMVPGVGVTYWFVFLFMFFLLLYIYKNGYDRSIWILIIWLIVASVPAALSSRSGNLGDAAIIMLPGLQILLGYGALEFINRLRTSLDQRLYLRVKYVFLLVVILSFLNFMEKYFILSPVNVAKGMMYTRLEAVTVAEQLFMQNEEIVISTDLTYPHIYFAFANKIDPKLYQAYSSTWKIYANNEHLIGSVEEYNLDRFIFKKIEWNKDSALYSNFIGLPEDFPANINPNYVLYYPDITKAVYFVNENINIYAYKNN